MNLDNEKRVAAMEAVKLIENGMIVGLGSGSTSAFMIEELGKMVANGLRIKGVPSSEATHDLAKKLGIPLVDLEEVDKIDINIDGADEFDPQLRLIKGGGGALLREKIVAHNSAYNVIIADSTKQVEKLGKFKLPIETIPFATPSILKELKGQGLNSEIRKKNNADYLTDQNNMIIDIDIYEFSDLDTLNIMLQNIPGIVETGLFLKSTDLVIVGKGDQTIKIHRKN
ncbi:ribose-5-phosphate isomerase RpiA [Flavimarina sp. Hel_I_48]|uniref:ribose-5-phosphate isomerase RpiA n=1 Tax=Flavimarina sp. Hel_I_48 TaxID=1392488 RepID=UPI0004DEEF0C|nr:ribose-5-phosphate isomerase RpiA [Flavimarina sp. Hel_I_48]